MEPMFFIGLLVGALISWGIAHAYHRKASRDQRKIFDKLSSEVREVILSDKRESITVAQLNELLRKKTLDESSDDVLPYKVCPKCGSENILRTNDFIVDVEPGDDGMPFHTAAPYKTIECDDCGWKDDEIDKDYERIK